MRWAAAIIGTIIGCAVGRGAGCAIGAGAGAAGGTAASAASPRTASLDSRRGSGHLPHGCAAHGEPGEPAGSGATGGRPVSRRPEPLPARPLRLRPALRLLFRLCLPGIRRFTTGRITWSAECTTGGKKDREQGSGNRDRNGHPARAGCPLCLWSVFAQRSAGHRVRSLLAVVYNGRVASSENCASAGAPRIAADSMLPPAGQACRA